MCHFTKKKKMFWSTFAVRKLFMCSKIRREKRTLVLNIFLFREK